MTFLNVDGFVRHVTQKTLTHMEITIVFDRHGLEILFWFKIIFLFLNCIIDFATFDL